MIDLWPTRIANETIQVLSGTPVEDYGNVVDTDWSAPVVDETIEWCSVQVVQTAEFLDNREAITLRVQMWVPGHHASLAGTKRVRWLRTGQEFQIDGSAQYQPDPFGLGLDHHTFFAEGVQG